MKNTTTLWESIYRQVPLGQVPQHFANIRNSPFTLEYLSTILRLCPPGGKTLETGTGSGYSAIWLSLRGVKASGIDLSPQLIERSNQINSLLSGCAQFKTGDLFHVFEEHQSSSQPRYDVIHHQGVLEHFNVPQIRAALAQQVASAHRVVFSVPSVYYPFDPEFGDERLLTLEDWLRILEPFDIEELRYYGDPQHGEKEHLLAVLRGQQITPELRALMEVPAQPFPAGITAIVHTRNEATRIEECLKSLQGWTDEIIVCDMESDDDTVAIAESLGAQVIAHPRIANFDRARNVSAMRASYRWIFYLDADERVPPALGEALRLVAQSQDALSPEEEGYVAGLLVPFRHHFSGHWMRCLYPGYTAPRLIRNGQFVFNARLHSGARVEGPIAQFPADDPGKAIVHFSYDNLSHYLGKLNSYTDGEALNLFRDGAPFHWQNAIREFVRDFQMYYQGLNAPQDGVHGFLYSFLSGFYRFEQHAKLYEHRFHSGQLTEGEKAVPSSLVEMLEFALQVAQEKPLPAPSPIPIAAAAEVKTREPKPLDELNQGEEREQGEETEQSEEKEQAEIVSPEVASLEATSSGSEPAEAATKGEVDIAEEVEEGPGIVWSGPLLDPSGYGEESRNFVFGLDDLGYDLTAQVLPWSHDEVDMPSHDRERLRILTTQPVRPGFTHIIHNLAPGFSRHPQAGISIGRTMFETDRLPVDWVKACNRMDYVWVPSEFHRQTFRDAGVPAAKLAVIPEAIDIEAYEAGTSLEALEAAVNALPAPHRDFLASLRQEQKKGKTFFLSVFDWTLHKGWDALLRGFLEAFEGRDDVVLLLKVWSTNGYGAQDIREQAARWAQQELGYDLLADERIRFVSQRLSRPGLCALYALADAFVLPSRGEGWGRPYMEAMACGKPVIGTNWSGNTAFMTPKNSYLLDYDLVDVPEAGWRELPTYRGHRWAEPRHEHLVQLLRKVEGDRAGAAMKGKWAREEVLSLYNREAVARHVVAELERIGAVRSYGEVSSYATHPSSQQAKAPTSSPSLSSDLSSSALIEQMVSDVAAAKSFAEDDVFEATSSDAAVLGAASKAENVEGESNENGAAHPTLALGDVDTRGLDQDHRDASLPVLNLPNPTLPVSHRELKQDSPKPAEAKVAVRWEGALFNWHSLGHVNREMCLGLLEQATGEGQPDVELSFVPTEPSQFDPSVDPRFNALAQRCFAPLSKAAQVDIRHFFPPRFDAPPEGRSVLIQPWEYGYLPSAWIEQIQSNVDQVWCYANYVKQVYLDSGIPEEKLRVIPLGFDPEVFRPNVPPYVFTNEPGAGKKNKSTTESQRPFTFLYVGGTIHRKGIDVLLEAYRRAFTSLDNVRLVIKDTGGSTVYRDSNSRGDILARIDDPQHPPIVYLEDDMDAPQLAGLFAGSDCLVAPYRGEGFCLPVLEAMACGTPVVVPQGGPTDDFVDETVGWFVPADHKPFHVDDAGRGHVGPWECVGPTWMFEVDPDELARLMRRIAADTEAQCEEVRRKGEAATLRAHSGWTWKQGVAKAWAALQELAALPPVERSHPSVPSLQVVPPLPAPQERVSSSDAPIVQQPDKDGTTSIGRSKPTISLCMIVKNEERVLGDCLRSASPWFDEVIVVDTGSTDASVSIAEELGAKVLHFPWCDDFSAARNVSLEHATGDWLFWMDADDTLPEECGKELRRLAELAENRVSGFIVPVHIPPAKGETGFTIVDHVKLFRNHPDHRFEGRIHEQILAPIHRTGGTIERSNAYVVHSGYDHSPAGQVHKRERDLRILEKDLADRPNHPFVLFNIGMTAYHMKDYEKAVSALQLCLEKSGPQESTVRKVYAMLAGCFLEQKQLEDARKWLERGLSRFPQDPELLFRAGIIYREVGELKLAAESYLKLLGERETGHIDSLDVTMTGFKAHHNLALIYLDLGLPEAAEHHFLQAVADNRTFVPSWGGLRESLAAQQKWADVGQADEVLRQLAATSA